nr:baseplate wedge protein 53 [Pseudomonadota bacterium]
MFFNNFPLIDYDINATGEYVLATNIMKRFRIRRSVVDNRSFYYNYELQDNERPEILAHKFYGNPNLHWLIMMT